MLFGVASLQNGSQYVREIALTLTLDQPWEFNILSKKK